ncbi:MAG: magnesium transporter, partial [Flavobacteriales bacterium]
TSTKTKISDIVKTEITAVTADKNAEAVAKIMQKYDLVVVPVIDDYGKLLGRITIDDVVDVITEEAEKDYHMASGISEKIGAGKQIFGLSKARLPWLIVGLLGGVLGAQVIGVYEEQLQVDPRLAFFIPMIAAMAGNVGVQSSAVVVQNIANESLNIEGVIPKLSRELAVGFLNGLILAALIFGYNILFFETFQISITVSLSLFSVIIFAAFFGTFIPLLLNKYKVDPALATGPFITTINDIFGIFIYFFIARMFY